MYVSVCLHVCACMSVYMSVCVCVDYIFNVSFICALQNNNVHIVDVITCINNIYSNQDMTGLLQLW